MKSILVLEARSRNELAISRLDLEPVIDWSAPFGVGVIVRTVRFVAKIIYFRAALHRFVKMRMKLEFFPSMAHSTAVLEWATVFIVFCILFAEPHLTLLRQVLINIGFSAEVLPIVSVHALVPGVGLVAKRTPNSFVVEHEKVHVFVHLLKQVNRKFIFMVRE